MRAMIARDVMRARSLRRDDARAMSRDALICVDAARYEYERAFTR